MAPFFDSRNDLIQFEFFLYVADLETPFRDFPRYDDWRDYTFYKYRATDVPTSCSDIESTTGRIIDSGMLITRTRQAL